MRIYFHNITHNQFQRVQSVRIEIFKDIYILS